MVPVPRRPFLLDVELRARRLSALRLGNSSGFFAYGSQRADRLVRRGLGPFGAKSNAGTGVARYRPRGERSTHGVGTTPVSSTGPLASPGVLGARTDTSAFLTIKRISDGVNDDGARVCPSCGDAGAGSARPPRCVGLAERRDPGGPSAWVLCRLAPARRTPSHCHKTLSTTPRFRDRTYGVAATAS